MGYHGRERACPGVMGSLVNPPQVLLRMRRVLHWAIYTGEPAGPSRTSPSGSPTGACWITLKKSEALFTSPGVHSPVEDSRPDGRTSSHF